MLDIRLLTTPEELDAVYRFRYSIAVHEMKWNESYTNHNAQLITDSLDGPQTKILGAWDNHELVGIVRSNYLRDGGIGDYIHYYQLNNLSHEELTKASISTLLMVHPKFRRTTLAARLVCETYRRGLEQGIETNYCDCDPHLVSFYIRLGYSIVDNHFVHPEFGPGHVMKLDMLNLGYLRAIRSPFLKPLLTYLSNHSEVNFHDCNTTSYLR